MSDDWWKQASCRDMDPGIFYPSQTIKRDFNRPDPRAVAACAVCPVREQCYLHALHKEDYGFWAGHTEQERRKLRKAAGVVLEPWRPYDFRVVSCGTPAGYQRHMRRGSDPCEACKDARTMFDHGYSSLAQL